MPQQIPPIQQLPTYSMVDAYTLQAITYPATPAPETNTYTLDYLLAQQTAIQAQMDNDNAARQAELDEVAALIAQCQTLGIVSSGNAVQANQIMPNLN